MYIPIFIGIRTSSQSIFYKDISSLFLGTVFGSTRLLSSHFSLASFLILFQGAHCWLKSHLPTKCFNAVNICNFLNFFKTSLNQDFVWKMHCVNEIQLMIKHLYTTIYLCSCAFAEFCCYGPYNLRWGYFLIRFIMSRARALYWSDFWSAYQNTLMLLIWNLSISLIRWGKTNSNIDIKEGMFNFWISY